MFSIQQRAGVANLSQQFKDGQPLGTQPLADRKLTPHRKIEFLCRLKIPYSRGTPTIAAWQLNESFRFDRFELFMGLPS